MRCMRFSPSVMADVMGGIHRKTGLFFLDLNQNGLLLQKWGREFPPGPMRNLIGAYGPWAKAR